MNKKWTLPDLSWIFQQKYLLAAFVTMPALSQHHKQVNCCSWVYPHWSSFKSREIKTMYSKTCLKQPLNAGQKYCRMLQGEHSAILSTFIKLPFSIKTFVLSILSGPLRLVAWDRFYCIYSTHYCLQKWRPSLNTNLIMVSIICIRNFVYEIFRSYKVCEKDKSR